MRKPVLWIMTLVVSVSGFAQQDTASSALEELVMVTRRSKQEKGTAPYAVEVVTQPYLLHRQPRTMPEALQGLNGVFVQKTNHGGGSPFLRGLTGNQVLVLVDGIRLNNSTFRYGPNQYLNTVDAYTINRLEVARGTGSVQYGSDAMGGVIQLLTTEPQFSDKPSFNGRFIGKAVTGGMEKTIRGEGRYATQRFALATGVTRRNFGDLIGGDTTGRQSPSGYDEWAYDIKAKWRLKEKAELVLANQLVRQSSVPVYHRIRLESFAVNEMDPQQRMLSYARLRLQSSRRFWHRTEVTLSLQNSLEGRNSRKIGSSTLRREEDKVQTLGLTLENESRITPFWTASSGIELYMDKVGSTRSDRDLRNNGTEAKRGLYPDGASYGNYSVFSLHHFAWQKLTVDAGLRYNLFSIRINDTTLGSVKITPAAVVANAAVLYQLFGGHHLYASCNSGYRAPNVDDMGTLGIVDFRYEVPTAALKPEKSNSFEAGYKYNSAKLTASVAAYSMAVSDLIARIRTEGQVISGYPVYRKENVEEATIRGVEAAVTYSPSAFLTLHGNLSSAHGQNKTRNEPLRRVPPLNGRAMATWQKQRWFFSVETTFAAKQDRLAQGDKDDNRIPAGGTPGWQVLNAYAGYTLAKLQVNTGLQNLFNKDYRTHGSGINGVGRSAWISITVDL